MGDETIVGGYVLGEALDLGTLSADEVAQVDTAINPDDNLYGVGVTVQGTSSVEYHTALNMRDLWQMPVYDEDTAITYDYERYSNTYIRRYNEGELRDRAEEYLRTTYCTRTEMREDFIRARSRHLDEIFLKGEWKIPEEEEQPDIKEERGGALDEFLEKFTQQKTTTERSDEQK